MFRFPNLNIIGFRNGFFESPDSEKNFINKLSKIQPEVVIVGMGAIRQERLLIKLWKKGWRGHGFTCGGFLHQTAKMKLDYYPELMNCLQLRWLYRIWDDPKLIWRYLFYYPIGMAFFIKDGLGEKLLVKIIR